MKAYKTLAAAAALLLCLALRAQGAFPEGMAVYSLPSTVIRLEVTAVCETFTPGPYARYAQKYLGCKAPSAASVKWSVKEVKFTGAVEADLKELHTVKLSASDASSSALVRMSSQGLVVFADANSCNSSSWRFPSANGGNAFLAKDMGENLTSVTNTLYKSVKTENGFDKVAVQQSEVVEKSLEKKAAEAAQRIFDLRKSRIQIITGDTDATFSGEALGAAIAEIGLLEQEYLSLFVGVTETSQQQMCFDVVPSQGNAKQMYVAFRISDEEGMLPAGSASGRPVIMSLEVESQPVAAPAVEGDRRKGSSGQLIQYRIPATATAKLLDGQKMLLSTRIPVYQLGTKVSIPL